MTIIQIEPLEDGAHPIQSQSHRRACWIEGYIEVPPHLEHIALDCLGYCGLTMESGILTDITPMERPPTPPPAMTTGEAVLDMLADLDYRMNLQELKGDKAI